jgi:hypothetical protein
MAKKIRTVEWCQQKILSVLNRQKEIKTYLALSALVLEKVQSVQESRNLNIAVTNLVINRDISKTKGKDGFIVYRLVEQDRAGD